MLDYEKIRIALQDEQFRAAVCYVVKTNNVKISAIKKFLKISYAQASLYMELMEKLGIVSEFKIDEERTVNPVFPQVLAAVSP